MVQGIDATFSLLQSQQRNRIEEDRKRAERDERNQALTKLLVKGGELIGNQVLANKTLDFINTTEQRGATQLAAQADTAIARTRKQWDAINASNQSPLVYLTEQVLPSMEKQVKANTPDWMEGLDEVAYQAKVYEAAKKVAQKRLDILTEAREIYEGSDMNDFSNRLEMVRTRYNPQSVGDMVTQGFAGLFDGKSKEDLDMEEMLAYKDFIDDQDPASRAYHGKRLIALNKAYEQTGDMVMSQVMATNEMIGNMEIDPSRGPIIEEIIVTPIKVGTSVVLQRRTKVTDNSRRGLDGQAVTYFKDDAEISLLDSEIRDGLVTETDLVTAAQQAFDVQEFFQDHLTNEGRDRVNVAMANHMVDGKRAPLSFGDINTSAKYKAVVDIIFDTVVGDLKDEEGLRVAPNLMVDKQAADRELAILRALIDVEVWAEFGDVFADPPGSDERKTKLSEALSSLAEIYAGVAELSGTAAGTDRGQP